MNEIITWTIFMPWIRKWRKYHHYFVFTSNSLSIYFPFFSSKVSFWHIMWFRLYTYLPDQLKHVLANIIDIAYESENVMLHCCIAVSNWKLFCARKLDKKFRCKKEFYSNTNIQTIVLLMWWHKLNKKKWC